MALDKKALAAAKRFTSDTADGLGAVKGAPATIKSITEVDSGQKVTFEWTGTSGTKQTSEMTVKDGISVTGISDKGNGVFTLLLSDGSESDPIQTIKGQKGDAGFNPTITENADNTDKIYKLDITTADTTFTTPNLKGADGQGGTGGSGEENVIESIKVNGVAQTVDADKSVDITVPSTEGLTKDADLATVAKSGDYEDLINKPTIPEAYDDTALSNRVTDVKDSIGDMSLIEVQSVSDLVSAINSLYNAFMSGITYANKKLTITYRNGSSVDIDMSAIITDTKLTELSDVDDTGITDKQVLSYDTATSKYIPTTIDTAGVLEDAKKYTDDEIKKINNADAIAVDEKPTYSDGTITYKKDGVESTITDGDYWFFYTVDGMAYQTIWIDGVEFTTSVDGSVDFKDFVSKTNDLTSTYTGEETDKTKVTTISALDALYAIISTALGKKVNTTDIVDNLSSDSTDKPLSAAQGKALDTKISDLATTVEEDYAKKTDLHSHTNKTVLDGITEEKVTAWDKAQENIIESVKVNNQEIIPDENKSVNIDLTGYAEHDEIVGENLIPYPYAQPERTTNGITFTFASDGSIIANGTATADADFSVCVRTNFGTDKAFMLKPGTYAITGCPEGGSDFTYRIHVQFGDKTGVKYGLKADYGKGFVFEVTEEHAQYACQIQCHVQKGYTVTDLVFKPMLVLGSVLREYQPYKLSREALRTDIADVTELASRVDNQFSTASGDYITVNDSVDGKLVELGIKGNSFQKSYAGYNLLPYPFYNTSKKVGNITVTDNKDGSITVNGTNGDSAVNVFDYVFRNHTFKAGTYHVSGVGRGWIGTYTVGTTNQIYASQIYDGEITFTVDADFDLLLRSTCDANGSYANVTYHPMIVKVADDGSYPTEYEPYVGGIPSPNPLYPQTINSVGDDGNIVVKSCGKNLIPYPYTHGGGNYKNVTITINDDRSITLNGTNSEDSGDYGFAGVSSFSAMKYMVRLKEGHTYRLSVEFFSGSLPDTSRIIINGWNDYSYVRGLASCSSKATSFTFTVPVNSGIKWGCIYLQNRQGHVFDNVRLRPMLVEVSEDGTYPTEYEFYNGSASTITLSEPLRSIGDVKDEITYQDGKWGVLRRTGSVILDGTEENCSESTINDSETSKCYKVEGEFNKSDIGNYITSYFSSHFEVVNSPTLLKAQGKTLLNVSKTNSALYLSFGTDIATIDDFKNFLSTNKPEFVYKLATPVFEPFADQTLPYLSTYDGVTNISNDDALSAEMTVKYPTTDASGVGSRNESRIAELAKDVDDKFDEVKMLGWSVPAECPIQNYTDSDGVFHQRVGRVDLGSLDWIKRDDNSFSVHEFLKDVPMEIKTFGTFCHLYSNSDWFVVTSNTVDKCITLFSYNIWGYASIAIRDRSYTDADTFKNAMQGVYLYYELVKEILIKIDGNEAISKVSDSLDVIGKCKNLLKPTLATTTKNGVTCTNNGDGTYTLNGTATDVCRFNIGSNAESNIINGDTYRAIGVPQSLGSNKVEFYDSNAGQYDDVGNGSIFTFNGSKTIVHTIYVYSGVTLNNVIIKPMLTTNLSATYDDFVPYTGDGDTLTHDVAEIKNDLSTKIYELAGSELYLCVSGKSCVLTLNGYNLTGSTNFSKLAEYPPYLVARNVVAKEDGVCIFSVDPNGNIGASDLQVASSVTGKMFGEVSWVVNI